MEMIKYKQHEKTGWELSWSNWSKTNYVSHRKLKLSDLLFTLCRPLFPAFNTLILACAPLILTAVGVGCVACKLSLSKQCLWSSWHSGAVTWPWSHAGWSTGPVRAVMDTGGWVTACSAHTWSTTLSHSTQWKLLHKSHRIRTDAHKCHLHVTSLNIMVWFKYLHSLRKIGTLSRCSDTNGWAMWA